MENCQTDRDVACPICGSELTSLGETVGAFGHTHQRPSEFGTEVVSFECGHRLHRACAVEWINQAPVPTCPMCRNITAWTPSLAEQRSRLLIMDQGWKTLSNTQQNFIALTWIIAACAAFTDPLGYLFVATILMLLTPPFFYSQMATFLAWLRKWIVSDKMAPGFRILIATGCATLVTVAISLSDAN